MQVSVDGADIHYTVHGQGAPCLVPSSIGTAPYARQLGAPLDAHLRLVVVDPRGAGRSTGAAADLTLDRLAQDLEAVRRALGVARVAVLGHSILGLFAVEYARRCPDSVSHVILVGTPPTGDMAALAAASRAFFEASADDERKRVLRENLAALPPNAAPGQQLLAQTPMRFFDPRADGGAVFTGADIRPDFIPHVMTRLAPGWDIRSGAAELRAPLFIGLGRHDYVVPHVLWDGVAAALPRATLQIFERSGHQPFFEEPAAFADAVSAWMTATASERS
jgi:proline iminopeptidase